VQKQTHVEVKTEWICIVSDWSYQLTDPLQYLMFMEYVLLSTIGTAVEYVLKGKI